MMWRQLVGLLQVLKVFKPKFHQSSFRISTCINILYQVVLYLYLKDGVFQTRINKHFYNFSTLKKGIVTFHDFQQQKILNGLYTTLISLHSVVEFHIYGYFVLSELSHYTIKSIQTFFFYFTEANLIISN